MVFIFIKLDFYINRFFYSILYLGILIIIGGTSVSENLTNLITM